MGFLKRISSNSNESCFRGTPNPDPRNFIVKEIFAKENKVAVEIYYPDATNFEGNKILVFEDKKEFIRLAAKENLDPHFIDGYSLIARFKPTDKGWQLAVDLVDSLSEQENE